CCSLAIFSRAIYGSIALPTTSMSSYFDKSSEIIFRTTAESSTTRTFIIKLLQNRLLIVYLQNNVASRHIERHRTRKIFADIRCFNQHVIFPEQFSERQKISFPDLKLVVVAIILQRSAARDFQ